MLFNNRLNSDIFFFKLRSMASFHSRTFVAFLQRNIGKINLLWSLWKNCSHKICKPTEGIGENIDISWKTQSHTLFLCIILYLLPTTFTHIQNKNRGRILWRSFKLKTSLLNKVSTSPTSSMTFFHNKNNRSQRYKIQESDIFIIYTFDLSVFLT